MSGQAALEKDLQSCDAEGVPRSCQRGSRSARRNQVASCVDLLEACRNGRHIGDTISRALFAGTESSTRYAVAPTVG